MLRCLIKPIMSSQPKILSFFKSPNKSVLSTKRVSNELGATAAVNESESTNIKKITDSPEAKKVRTEKENDVQNESSDKKLSQNDKKRMEQNRALAKLKLLASKTNGVATNIGDSWFPVLEPEFNKDYFKELGSFVAAERNKGKIYPPADQVFTWTKACNVKDVKVVILGQDPYHGPNQAHGLCFSVVPGVRPPPSLANMFKELESDIDGFTRPDHGNLIGWATQGVLLLNACLTVRAGQANSHSGKGWEKLTDAVIHWLNSNSKGVVFMLWGSYAQKKGSFINKNRHHVLKAVHPSPLSAHRGFFGCKHFSKCNELLKADGNQTIDWTQLPRELD